MVQLENVFTESANATFLNYTNTKDNSSRDAWDSFQKSVSVYRCHWLLRSWSLSLL